jgi:glycosyltransferase involved in cell wall biosynthesis
VAGIWVVVPVFDEVATLGRVVEAVRAHCPVIVVDDASTDESARVAIRSGAAEVLRHPRREGKGAALRTGFAAALRHGAAAVATLDADGQHEPADLPRLLAAHRGAPDALILGDRFGGAGGDPIPPLRRAAIRAADRILRALLPEPVSDTQCGFRIYPGAFLRDVPLREERFVLETEALVRAVRAGYRLVSVPVRSVYPKGRQSRFQAVTDAARIGWYLARAGMDGPGLTPPARPTALAPARRLAGELSATMVPLRDVSVVGGEPAGSPASSSRAARQTS